MQKLVCIVLWCILIIFVSLPGPSQGAHMAKPYVICRWECLPYDFRADWFYPKHVRPCKCIVTDSSSSANCSGVHPCNMDDPSSKGRNSSVEPAIAKAIGGSL